MYFLTPFIIGFITGGVIMWQRNRRKQRTVEAIHTEEQNRVDAPASDDLTAIRGVGPVYAKRLNMAGIQNFAQLAELDPEKVTEIVAQGKNERLIDTHDWIVQAQRIRSCNE